MLAQYPKVPEPMRDHRMGELEAVLELISQAVRSARRWNFMLASSLSSTTDFPACALLGLFTDLQAHGWLGRPPRPGRSDDPDGRSSRCADAPHGWLPQPCRRRTGRWTCGPAVSLVQFPRPVCAATDGRTNYQTCSCCAQQPRPGRMDGRLDLLLLRSAAPCGLA